MNWAAITAVEAAAGTAVAAVETLAATVVAAVARTKPSKDSSINKEKAEPAGSAFSLLIKIRDKR